MIRLCSPSARTEPDGPSLGAARAAVAALGLIGLIGLPAAMLGPAGRTIALNSQFEQLMPDVVRESRTQLQLANAAADARLSDTLARIAAAETCEEVRSIPIAAADGQPPMILHLVPLRGARERFPGVVAMLVVSRVRPKQVPSVAVLQELLDLTPAEARVARGVAQRQTIDRIAGGLGLSQETVRTQLKAVLAKTGLARNIDLAVALAGASLPIPADTT